MLAHFGLFGLKIIPFSLFSNLFKYSPFLNCYSMLKSSITPTYWFQDLLKQDISDYFLFVFAAITNGEIGNDCEAISYYKKATELDADKPLAWQGLYKLYEQGKYVDLEHIVIVIQNLLRIPGYVSNLFKRMLAIKPYLYPFKISEFSLHPKLYV